MKKKSNKIYFWLKLDHNFFKNLAIKQAMKIPGGKEMILIYQMLMLESLATEGVLYYEGILSSIEKELAIKLEVTEEEIQMTLSYFKGVGLIQIDDFSNAEMLQVPALMKQETNWAEYKRNQREQKRLDNVQSMSKGCPTEIEKEIEKELEQDIELETDISSSSCCINNKKDSYTVQQLLKDFEAGFGRLLSPFEIEDIQKYVTEENFQPELIREALKEGVYRGKPIWNYIKAILRNWKADHLLTVEQVRAKQEEQGLKVVSEVSEDFLAAMELWKE